ncbi:MAG: 2-amino-4-hydroxy-6-hydroxymethyldihydropteridine diphosphokinase [bacterium]|nr:2-amino-4-hydroxy-6-hydroxymethyldihydropteridine diphosphokinase [bacterium]
MRRAFLALGSNLGDRRALLAAAVASLDDVVAISPVYETDPVGPPGQGSYLNIAVELRTERSARELLKVAFELESEAGRRRRVRWGPRTLDVDVLWVEGETVDEPDLSVPHPRMHERGFVMVPLGDLAPELAPGWTVDSADGVYCAGELGGA